LKKKTISFSIAFFSLCLAWFSGCNGGAEVPSAPNPSFSNPVSPTPVKTAIPTATPRITPRPY
jgi:hypothetical protein